MHTFAFESYGVKIRIESNRKRIIARVESIARKSMMGQLTEIDSATADHFFVINQVERSIYYCKNGGEGSTSEHSRAFYKYFESMLRVTVAEFAVGYVFIHAGVVAWKGKAILFPADSFQGKTTLVAALVKKGAVYYSDDYAIIDEHGFVHPFARPLSIRDKKRDFYPSKVDVASLGGIAGTEAIPVGAIIITKYRKNAKWNPRILSSGLGMIEMIQQTIPINHDPDFSIMVLKKLAERAIVAKSLRGDSKKSAFELLSFVDNLVNWATM